MKIFIDMEFTELSTRGKVLSIGMVSEDNRDFYAEIHHPEFENGNAYGDMSPWIQENVIPGLIFPVSTRQTVLPTEPNKFFAKGGVSSIREDIFDWLEEWKLEELEWVVDVGHYDFIHFIDILFGNAINTPSWFSPVYLDLNDEISSYYNITRAEAFGKSREDIVKELDAELENDSVGENAHHNALYDARVIRRIWRGINKKETDTERLKEFVNQMIRNTEENKIMLREMREDLDESV